MSLVVELDAVGAVADTLRSEWTAAVSHFEEPATEFEVELTAGGWDDEEEWEDEEDWEEDDDEEEDEGDDEGDDDQDDW